MTQLHNRNCRAKQRDLKACGKCEAEAEAQREATILSCKLACVNQKTNVNRIKREADFRPACDLISPRKATDPRHENRKIGNVCIKREVNFRGKPTCSENSPCEANLKTKPAC